MGFSNPKYARVISYVQRLYERFNSWEDVKSIKGSSDPEHYITSKASVDWDLPDFSLNEWEKVVDYQRNEAKKGKAPKLSRDILNDFDVPNDEDSCWQLYKNKLVDQNWSFKSIKNIEESSIDILKHLSLDTTKIGPTKGLVVGNVQSGKTANMAGLMAMAADHGFNYFVILSGMIENLRKQTAERLYNDMNYTGYMLLNWQQIDNPSLRSRAPEHDISSFHLSKDSRHRYFTVCLKNSSRLANLIKWLESDKNKAKQIKMLIIDDEADQASINTRDINVDEYTRINGLIRKLVHSDSFKAINYIAYTATPYANILNETAKDSLYPRDFIYLLEESGDYIGPKQLFNLEEPETEAPLPIVRYISDKEVKKVHDIHKNPYTACEIPQSLKDAIMWFIISVAIQRFYNYDKPVTMLIHTSFKIIEHENIAKKVESYLTDLKINFTEYIHGIKKLYRNEMMDFNHEHFLKSMKNYTFKESVLKLPEWDEILPYIERIADLHNDEYLTHIPLDEEGLPRYHKGVHLVIDNSQSYAGDEIKRLVYPRNSINPAPAFIVIGGNTLSRGLTLEGLTTTYFLRNTKQADTLMQMARWFGYRRGYETLPRVWMDFDALQRFEFLAQMNEELREEIKEYAKNGFTPIEYAPRVKNSSNYQLIRITSRNKSQSAEPTEFDFSGFNSQTTYFENNAENLKYNIEITKDFLNSLDSPMIDRNYMIWKDVSLERVRPFLESYIASKKIVKFSKMKELLDWLEINVGNIANWNVVYSSIGKIENTLGADPNWNIHGYSPLPVKRSKLKNASSRDFASIGALRSPIDLLADITEVNYNDKSKISRVQEVHAMRKKYGYYNTPLLIVYKIDSGRNVDQNYIDSLSRNREPLNFVEDVIGLNIMIPGETRKGFHSKYLTVKVDSMGDEEDLYEVEMEEQ